MFFKRLQHYNLFAIIISLVGTSQPQLRSNYQTLSWTAARGDTGDLRLLDILNYYTQSPRDYLIT